MLGCTARTRMTAQPGGGSAGSGTSSSRMSPNPWIIQARIRRLPAT